MSRNSLGSPVIPQPFSTNLTKRVCALLEIDHLQNIELNTVFTILESKNANEFSCFRFFFLGVSHHHLGPEDSDEPDEEIIFELTGGRQVKIHRYQNKETPVACIFSDMIKNEPEDISSVQIFFGPNLFPLSDKRGLLPLL